MNKIKRDTYIACAGLIGVVIIAVAVAFMAGMILTGCRSGPPAVLDKDPHNAFNQIRSVYIKDIHDCDDMAQEFRDFLVDYGHAGDDAITLVIARHEYFTNMGHAWLEVKMRDGTERIFDLALGAFSYLRQVGDVYSQYEAKIRIKGVAFDEGTGGYKNRGDRFIDGEWVRAK